MRDNPNRVQYRNTKPQTGVPLPRTTSDTSTTEVPDEPLGADSVKNNGGLSSPWGGARWSWGQSPASSWVGRPCGRCPPVSSGSVATSTFGACPGHGFRCPLCRDQLAGLKRHLTQCPERAQYPFWPGHPLVVVASR